MQHCCLTKFKKPKALEDGVGRVARRINCLFRYGPLKADSFYRHGLILQAEL